jgi:hypothetical protein
MNPIKGKRNGTMRAVAGGRSVPTTPTAVEARTIKAMIATTRNMTLARRFISVD